jgi:uncharacterized Tic20 family protein
MTDDAPSPAGEAPFSSSGQAADPMLVTSDERLWAMLAHLAGILGYLGGIGQYVVPLVIYLSYKDRSQFVAFHALQSLYFQLGVLAAGFAVLAIALLTCVGGLLALPLSVGALAYAIVAAIRANQGEWFEYWLVGEWARRQVIDGRTV